MATKKTTVTSKKNGTEMLEQKIAKLEAENKQLKATVKSKDTKKSYGWLRALGVSFFVTLSIVAFMLFNLSSWVKNTVLDTDTFVATMQPVIAESAVQKVIQDDITEQLFEQVDIEAKLQEALPEQIAFLSGPLANQVESFTYSKVGSVLASQQVYDLWGTSLETVHSKLLDYINNPDADGVITVNDVYAAISSKVSDDRKISFLFNKTLPDKVGTIELREVKWLPEARSYVHAITIAPPIFLLTSIVAGIIAVLLSLRRRLVVGTIIALTIVMMGATLAALQVGNWEIGQVAQQKNVAAAQAIYSTITSPLEARTIGYTALLSVLFVVLLLTSNISWIRKSKQYLHSHIQKISDALFKPVSVPNWLNQINDKAAIIGWTASSVLFVVVGVRIPPVADQVLNGVIVSLSLALVIYIAHVVVNSLDRRK